MLGFEPLNPNPGARVHTREYCNRIKGGATMLSFLVPLLLIVVAVELDVVITKLDAIAKRP